MKRAVLGLSLVLAVGATASAQDEVATFYKGKTLRLAVKGQ